MLQYTPSVVSLMRCSALFDLYVRFSLTSGKARTGQSVLTLKTFSLCWLKQYFHKNTHTEWQEQLPEDGVTQEEEMNVAALLPRLRRKTGTSSFGLSVWDNRGSDRTGLRPHGRDVSRFKVRAAVVLHTVHACRGTFASPPHQYLCTSTPELCLRPLLHAARHIFAQHKTQLLNYFIILSRFLLV